MNEARCEPPEELRGVDGWHWVLDLCGKEALAHWHPNGDGETWAWAIPGQGAGLPNFMWRHGYRYLAPVTHPAEVEALRAEVEKLRGAAAYQAEAHTLRTAMKMLAEKLRSWGWQNRKNEANHIMVSRALDEQRAEVERLRADACLMALALLGQTPDSNTQDAVQATATQAALDAAVARWAALAKEAGDAE